MPILSIQTNIPAENVSQDLLKELSQKVAKLLHKPESYVAVHIQGGQSISFGGTTTEPCAYGTLKSIGGVGGKVNKEHAKVLYEIIEKSLGISGDRMYIEFVDLATSNVAFSGSTFA